MASTLRQRREGHSIADRFVLGEALRDWALPAVVVDNDGNYLAANTAARSLTGYGRRELLALGARGLVVDDELETLLVRMVKGTLRGGETVVRTNGGRRRRVAYRVGATRIEDVPCHLVVFWAID